MSEPSSTKSKNWLAVPLSILVVAVTQMTVVASGAIASDGFDGYEVDTNSIGREDNQGVVHSGQILELGVPSANGLHIEGEKYLQAGHVDEALVVLQRALELAPNDVDIRILYAKTLEKKLIRQPRQTRDPGLFNFIVKQWLCVAKSGEFGDQINEGYSHLAKLTGTYPKKREKEKKFLERVLIPEDGSVPVVLGAHLVPANKKQVATKGSDLQ